MHLVLMSEVTNLASRFLNNKLDGNVEDSEDKIKSNLKKKTGKSKRKIVK